MLAKLEGLKTTIPTLMGTVVIFGLLMHFQLHWQAHLGLVTQLVLPVLVLTALFAAWFNRSRIALLMLCWIGYYVTSNYSMPWSLWAAGNVTWLILTGGTLLLMLSLIKDRALLSLHGVIHLTFIALCGAFAFGWLWLLNHFEPTLAQLTLWPQIKPHLPLTVPLAIMALVMLWRALRHSSLTEGTVLATFVVWYCQSQGWIDLPWPIILSALSAMYLLDVTADSYNLAYRDDLTGLPTRRALNHLAMSLGRKYTVAMLDIDHFKKFNDTYGHDIGDQVLKLVASKLAAVKGGGKVYRYGGEEFTVVFPRKTMEHALPHLEQLRQAVADYAMVVRKPQRTGKKSRQSAKANDQKTVSVTISIGVCQRQGGQTFEQALKEADLALYRAKKKGRNNVSQ